MITKRNAALHPSKQASWTSNMCTWAHACRAVTDAVWVDTAAQLQLRSSGDVTLLLVLICSVPLLAALESKA